MHPIMALQGALVMALAEDSALTALIGPGAIFDAPPKGKAAPYVVVARHDLLARDGDAAPGFEHWLVLNLWAGEPSRRAVVAIVERVLAVALTGGLDGEGLVVTHRRHERTETLMDTKTGQARAAISLRFFSEPDEN